MVLGPCEECARHVRVGADRCPFCGAQTVAEPKAVRRVSRRDLTRAAMFAGAALAVGCGGGETEAGGGDATSGGDDQGGGDATSGGGGGGQGGDEELSPCQIDPRRCRSSSPACDDCPVPPYGAPAVDVIV